MFYKFLTQTILLNFIIQIYYVLIVIMYLLYTFILDALGTPIV